MFTCAGQGVAHQWLVDKLSLIESGHTVQMETFQTDHMTLSALKHQNWSPARHRGVKAHYTELHHIISVCNTKFFVCLR